MNEPDKGEADEGAVEKAPLAALKLWSTPKVILGRASRTHGGSNINTDVDFSQTS